MDLIIALFVVYIGTGMACMAIITMGLIFLNWSLGTKYPPGTGIAVVTVSMITAAIATVSVYTGHLF